MEKRWEQIQEDIECCFKCSESGFREVLCKRAKKHPSEDPSNVKILFVSEAPPASGDYFYDETRSDGLREKLFPLLRDVGFETYTIPNFLANGFYLVPTVKCPSGKPSMNMGQINNLRPRTSVIKLCVRHLARELAFIKPKRIVLLGGKALEGCSRILSGLHRDSVERARKNSPVIASLHDLTFEVYPSYWPTPRHGHIDDMKDDLRRALK